MTKTGVALAVALAVSGCAMEDDTLIEDEATALEGGNGLSFNGLSFNGVIVNGLSFNGLSFNGASGNGLSFNGLSFNGLSFNGAEMDGAPLTEDQLAQLEVVVSYMVECALAPAQSATIERADGTTFDVAGVFGLAPGWRDAPPSAEDEIAVSSCMLARANANGQHVMISMRGEYISTGAAEQSAYPYFEGVYWGNLFSDTPSMKACRGDYLNDSNGRLCSEVDENGYANPSACGFDVVGACALNCFGLDDDGHYLECMGSDGVASVGRGVTVFLDDGSLTASAGAALPPAPPEELVCTCFWSDKRGQCMFDPADACKRECGFTDCMYTSPTATTVCEPACEAGPIGGDGSSGGGSGDGGGSSCTNKKKC